MPRSPNVYESLAAHPNRVRGHEWLHHRSGIAESLPALLPVLSEGETASQQCSAVSPPHDERGAREQQALRGDRERYGNATSALTQHGEPLGLEPHMFRFVRENPVAQRP